jgi:feruloyl esterase
MRRLRRSSLVGLVWALASVVAYAADAPSASRTVLDLASACRSDVIQTAVAKLTPAITIKAVSNPTGPALPGGAKLTPATSDLPAFCQVTGSFVTNARTGKTANFLATFPAAWNGKYLQMGCSGHCGQFAVSNAAMPFVTVTNQGLPGDIIRKGYASIATDEGHEGFGSGAWAVKGPGQVDEDFIDDFYYRADQVLAHLGKEFTVAFYTQAMKAPQKIARSYFSGCSGGGRDAFVAASYFPEEFDGIIGGSAYNLMGTGFQAAGYAAATLRSEDAAAPIALLRRTDSFVKAKCDKLDGVEDGLVQNPMACDFRPDRDLPRCADNKPGEQCFTQAQVETISTVVTAVTDEDGNLVQPGFSVTELNPGFAARPKDLAAIEPWPDSGTTTSGLWGLADAALKVFVHKNDPDFHTRSLLKYQAGGPGTVTAFRTVVPKAEVAKAMAQGRPGIGHFPENADRLLKLNRKFLIWHNLSDEKLTPYMSVNYYKQLAKSHGGYGKLQQNVRLFLLPGTGHCSGGYAPVGPGSFDALSAMEDWVEKGKAPDGLMATLYQPTSTGGSDFSKPQGRTMPLCKFPEMARYSGKGDVKDGANWSCPANDQSMLKVGESGRQAGVIE